MTYVPPLSQASLAFAPGMHSPPVLKDWGSLQRLLDDEREKIMVERFEQELEEILIAHPELKEKQELKILATMGSAHTTLFHKFRESGVDTQKAFPSMPYIYDFITQLDRDLMYHREPSRDVVAKAYLTDIIINKLLPNGYEIK